MKRSNIYQAKGYLRNFPLKPKFQRAPSLFLSYSLLLSLLFFVVVTSGYKISPIIFDFTIIFCRHVSNFTSRYKISPIIFAFTIIFCPHVSNVTSHYKISSIIFTFTIIFCRHVSNVTSRDKISPILGCRAPLGAIRLLG